MRTRRNRLSGCSDSSTVGIFHLPEEHTKGSQIQQGRILFIPADPVSSVATKGCRGIFRERSSELADVDLWELVTDAWGGGLSATVRAFYYLRKNKPKLRGMLNPEGKLFF